MTRPSRRPKRLSPNGACSAADVCGRSRKLVDVHGGWAGIKSATHVPEIPSFSCLRTAAIPGWVPPAYADVLVHVEVSWASGDICLCRSPRRDEYVLGLRPGAALFSYCTQSMLCCYASTTLGPLARRSQRLRGRRAPSLVLCAQGSWAARLKTSPNRRRPRDSASQLLAFRNCP
jgi:hypothetical protein